MPKISIQNVFMYEQRDKLTVSKGNTAAWPGVGLEGNGDCITFRPEIHYMCSSTCIEGIRISEFNLS